MSYHYTTRNLFADPPYHYMFTPFEGEAFLAGYAGSRAAAIAGWNALALPGANAEIALRAPGAAAVETDDMLQRLVGYLLNGGSPAAPAYLRWVDGFARKFETFKRLRKSYTAGFTALDRTPAPASSYARLAFLIAAAAGDAEDLHFLNALLKLNDHILSVPVEEGLRGLVRFAVERELRLVAAKNSGRAARRPLSRVSAVLTDVALLGAWTPRTRAYLDAMRATGIMPSDIVLLRRNADETDDWEKAAAGSRLTVIEAEDVNAPAVVEAVAALCEEYVIFPDPAAPS